MLDYFIRFSDYLQEIVWLCQTFLAISSSKFSDGLVVLSEVCIGQVEAVRGPGHREVGDVGAPLVSTLPAAPLVVGEPQPLAHALTAVNPEAGLLDPAVLPQLGLGLD